MAKTRPFTDHYEQYEVWFDHNYYAYQSELRAVGYFIPESRLGIEVGVGSGKFAAPLEIGIGIDPSESMRALAAERGVTVYDAVAEALPFTKEQFDFALLVTTICFVDDIDAALGEIYRILKQKGLIIVGFVDKVSPLGNNYQKHKEENVFYREATFYSTDEGVDALRRNGFENFQIIQTIFGKLSEIDEIQDFTKGYGDGGFVVIRAQKVHG